MKQIAFWENDIYPFALWGEIDKTKICKDEPEYKYIKSYQGFFKPFLILNEVAARELIKELEELTFLHRTEKERVRKSFRAKLIEVIPEHPKL